MTARSRKIGTALASLSKSEILGLKEPRRFPARNQILDEDNAVVSFYSGLLFDDAVL